MKTLESYFALALGLTVVFVDMPAPVKLIGGAVALSLGAYALVQAIRKQYK
ncbi:hypothetical protein RQN30_02255 [Arcanobacterium hippocoleae]